MAEARLLFIDDANIVTMSTLKDVPNSSEVSIVLKASVTLNNDQIKTLPSTPCVIIPATQILDYTGFPTKGFLPIRAFAVLDTTSGAYTNVGNVHALIGWGPDPGETFAQTMFSGNAADIQFLFADPTKSLFQFTAEEGFLAQSNGYLADNSLVIQATNSMGNFQDGHANNTLTVTVYYAFIDI